MVQRRSKASEPSPPCSVGARPLRVGVRLLRSILHRAAASLRDEKDPEIVAAQGRVILRRVQVAGWIAFILVPLTFISYLASFRSQAIERGILVSVTADLAVLALQLGVRRGLFDRRPHLAFFLLMGVISNFAANSMIQIALSEGDAFFTDYLVFFGTATIFPARLVWVAATCGAVIAGYPIGEWLSGHVIPPRELFSNLLRLFDFGFVTLIGNRVITTLFLRERRTQAELASANARLQEIDRLKSDFFANLSHELRTPLTLILAPLGSVLESRSAPLPERARELLETARRHAGRLLELINDLLLLARLDAGKVECKQEMIDVVGLAREVVDSIRPLAAERALRLRFKAPASLLYWRGDRRHLERVLLNLLCNACKFSRPGGRVWVGITDEPDTIALEVHDEGTGIRAEDLPRIFDRFVQAESSANRRFEGSGIGLALVKELTELYGGRVSVASEPNVGSTFRVRLPRAKAQESGLGLAPSPPPAITRIEPTAPNLFHGAPRTLTAPVAHLGDRPRLMIVEDNLDLLDYLSGELSLEFDITALADSREALRSATGAPPDLVVSDVMMPLLDGIELCRLLRGEDRTREVPIILISARGDLATKLCGFSEGADDYVPKPFEMSELRARIRLQLQLRAQAAALARRNAELTRLSDHLAGALRQVREAEVRVIQNEKLATLGTVVAGVAHEINNPLHFVQGNLALLRRLVPQTRDGAAEKSRLVAGDLLRDMKASLERIASVTRSLYQFARSEKGLAEDIDLEALYELVRKLLANQVGAGVRLRAALGEARHIRGASQELFQVLVNLIQNALHAVGERGSIEVSARLTEGGVDLSVRDDGPGIPRERQSRIFEPFYTTKPAGEGLGLGLSIVQRIAASHGGSVRVESEPGQGTTFTVHLPQSP